MDVPASLSAVLGCLKRWFSAAQDCCYYTCAGACKDWDVAINDPRSELRVQRTRLVLELSSNGEVAQEKSQTRKIQIRQGIRDVAVQAVATALGGSVLAGLGLVAGLIPPDPAVILVVAVLSVTLLLAVFFTVRSASALPITHNDIELVKQIDAIDSAIALLDNGVEVTDFANPQSGV